MFSYIRKSLSQKNKKGVFLDKTLILIDSLFGIVISKTRRNNRVISNKFSKKFIISFLHTLSWTVAFLLIMLLGLFGTVILLLDTFSRIFYPITKKINL